MSNSVDIMINGRETVNPAATSAVAGLGKLNDALHGTETRLKGFNQVMELAFGFHIGRFFFEKLHEGLNKSAEAFEEAQKSGMGFTDSLMDATRAALGLATATDRIKENLKHIRAGEIAFGKGINATSSKTAAESFKEAREQFETAFEQADTARGASTSIGENFLRALFTPFGDAQNAFAPKGTEARNIALTANEAKRKIAQASDAYQRARYSEDFLNFFSPMVSPIANAFQFRGFPIIDAASFRGTAEARLGQGAGAIGSGLGILERIVGAPFSAFGNAILTGAGAKFARGEAREGLEEELRIQRMRLTEAQSAFSKRDAEVHSVGADNARFLTRGGGPLHSPEVAALEKTNAHLEEIKKKIADLESKLANFAAVGAVAKL